MPGIDQDEFLVRVFGCIDRPDHFYGCAGILPRPCERNRYFVEKALISCVSVPSFRYARYYALPKQHCRGSDRSDRDECGSFQQRSRLFRLFRARGICCRRFSGALRPSPGPARTGGFTRTAGCADRGGRLIKRHRASVQRRAHKSPRSVVNELEREKGGFFGQKAEEYLIPFPDVEPGNVLFRDPFKDALVAFYGLSLKSVRREQVHVFRHAVSGHESDDPPEPIGRQRVSGLLADLAHEALLRALVLLEVASHTDPFVLVYVVLLHHPVQHQVFPVPFQIAKRTQLYFQVVPPAAPAPVSACVLPRRLLPVPPRIFRAAP